MSASKSFLNFFGFVAIGFLLSATIAPTYAKKYDGSPSTKQQDKGKETTAPATTETPAATPAPENEAAPATTPVLDKDQQALVADIATQVVRGALAEHVKNFPHPSGEEIQKIAGDNKPADNTYWNLGLLAGLLLVALIVFFKTKKPSSSSHSIIGLLLLGFMVAGMTYAVPATLNVSATPDVFEQGADGVAFKVCGLPAKAEKSVAVQNSDKEPVKATITVDDFKSGCITGKISVDDKAETGSMNLSFKFDGADAISQNGAITIVPDVATVNYLLRKVNGGGADKASREFISGLITAACAKGTCDAAAVQKDAFGPAKGSSAQAGQQAGVALVKQSAGELQELISNLQKSVNQSIDVLKVQTSGNFASITDINNAVTPLAARLVKNEDDIRAVAVQNTRVIDRLAEHETRFASDEAAQAATRKLAFDTAAGIISKMNTKAEKCKVDEDLHQVSSGWRPVGSDKNCQAKPAAKKK